MGANNSTATMEKPSTDTIATLYYFEGRGLADQIRWMLAASEISFTQRIVDSRKKFLKMKERQLPFGQLPLLQIDGLEIVQSQSIVRYLARRAHLNGKTPEDEVKCEMIAETIKDLLPLLCGAPFARINSKEAFDKHLLSMKEKWLFIGSRLEAVLKANGGNCLVGESLTYADILTAHAVTWYVEECGPEVVIDMPNLVKLQNTVIALRGVNGFIRSSAWYPIGDKKYVDQVCRVLDRKI